MAADRWGIEDRFHDAFGGEHVTTPETRAEVLRAMGIDPRTEPGLAADADGVRATAAVADAADAGGVRATGALADAADAAPVRVVQPGEATPVARAGELRLEDGALIRLGAGDTLPPDLPLGYHDFTPEDDPGRAVRIICSPGSCHLPEDLQSWGWTIQLYAARSRASWGIGDLADLRALGALTRSLGGEVLMVNPLSAPAPVVPVEASPYYPSSRRFRNPLYLRIEEIPGVADAGPAVAAEIAALAADGRALGADRRIDRDRVFALKMKALELLWTATAHGATGDVARFEAYRREQGRALDEFAVHSALTERHGRDWRRWPEEYRHPGSEAVRRVVLDDPRVRFFSWVQWLIDQQLARASAEVKVIHDLPVGLDIAGADAWCWQDLMARDVSVGCPPDEFNSAGQDWGLCPFVPTKLRAAGYRPFVETVRALLRHAGGLRIDHVMGLFRLYWIPRALGARGGTYVRYVADELLAIVALESRRARAFIVGEDLGTVEPGTREEMAARAMLSYRLLYFEPAPPPDFPELALSSVTTHDLATVAGLWTGAAIEHARAAGLVPNEAGMTALRERLAKLAGLAADAPVEEAIVAVHRALARAPSRVLLATLDDALAVGEQPNIPGTTTTWPNWSLALPRTIEEIAEMELLRRVADALRRSR
jgi:4-alpha-glucanotransferase